MKQQLTLPGQEVDIVTDTETQEKGGLDVETLEASFAVVAPEAERLVQRFYEVLFERHPAVKPMFADSDMKQQRSKLLAAIKFVIANVRNTDALVPALQEMGRRHESYGAEPDHYVAVAQVLISVMEEIAGDKWTGEAFKAWSDALALIAETMIGAYTGTRTADDLPAGPPGDVERRSPDRPWAAASVDEDAADESQAVPHAAAVNDSGRGS